MQAECHMEPATVVNQCAPNCYWIIQENGAQQPKVYRYTRTFLKIRSTPTDGKAKAQMKEWMQEKENVEFHIPAILNGNRNPTVKNYQGRSSSSSLTPPLPTLDLPNSEIFSEKREESQLVEPLCTDGTTLENALDASNAPVQCKSTRKNFGQEPHRFRDQLHV